jgi:hypothetical protein
MKPSPINSLTAEEAMCEWLDIAKIANVDESRVLAMILGVVQLADIRLNTVHRALYFGRRLIGQGRESYGPLDVATDQRDLRGREINEEIADALVYLAASLVKEQVELGCEHMAYVLYTRALTLMGVESGDF